ncbi:hypothetical protein N7472_003779 [Penicillium cf. griseofulvum]|uniref:SRR1-like domain-containing protein n=1 Tax=Penicillium cf. griseofulvum TaxID=2972120 RepID=A0A9W9MTS0_9EURO|nr:hypothetical protein N7472_003779 [Penicillium cf. griseofulvum]KAJ5447677.1 hypothetical protein N7445_002498 [Penicillium cf. griseofulvum]
MTSLLRALLAPLVKSWLVGLEEAFFPLQIEHLVLKRARDTKLPVLADYIQNSAAKQSPEWRNLEAILKLVTTHKIIKVVGIASESMELGPNGEQCTLCSTVQHSIMITIKESIEEKSEQQIRCYFQDRRYTAVDHWALTQHGCEALPEIDNNCILFSCCPALPLKESTVDFARPAMIKEYDCHELRDIHEVEEAFFKSHLVVYIRRKVG